MKRMIVVFVVMFSLVSHYTFAYSKTINEADTELCDTLQYALINSLRNPIDKAINEIYKEDDDAPELLSWASYQTEIVKIKQSNGVGGIYEITLKVMPYYGAHNTYGEDIIVVNSAGKLIDYEHLKTYPRIDYN
ncbi:DUF3888 domain-containing protein [Radiobacillus deserti]|uniref:DUF3888 domain-containing protein n=1 Tax=Radiobacillus deserti TaxID=2594883 RepID=A0A516KIF2_9BACI|nr:DUF3888 domain-containing protein [Radiobacillus deserti]QDP41161.1 DUF3888 domain-containing protein [Radiobacillus deserti]